MQRGSGATGQPIVACAPEGVRRFVRHALSLGAPAQEHLQREDCHVGVAHVDGGLLQAAAVPDAELDGEALASLHLRLDLQAACLLQDVLILLHLSVETAKPEPHPPVVWRLERPEGAKVALLDLVAQLVPLRLLEGLAPACPPYIRALFSARWRPAAASMRARS